MQFPAVGACLLGLLSPCSPLWWLELIPLALRQTGSLQLVLCQLSALCTILIRPVGVSLVQSPEGRAGLCFSCYLRPPCPSDFSLDFSRISGARRTIQMPVPKMAHTGRKSSGLSPSKACAPSPLITLGISFVFTFKKLFLTATF